VEGKMTSGILFVSLMVAGIVLMFGGEVYTIGGIAVIMAANLIAP
jgi:hypothetical protein